MTNNNKVELKITGDGSHTLFVPGLNENYHSGHGAYTESMHVFIEHGLKHVIQKSDTIHLFEIGFGTGLNAILTYQFIQSYRTQVKYCGIELNPVSSDIIIQLNYSKLWNDPEIDRVFKQMHEVEWNKSYLWQSIFGFEKIHGSVLAFKFPVNQYHLIYFDAFAPDKQPELWTLQILQSMYESLQPGGILVTYCAKGQFKRDLKSAGFLVETLPGPPGKREMVRAIK